MIKLLAVFFLAAVAGRVSSLYTHSGSAETIPYDQTTIKNLPGAVRFVGRSFYNITIISTRGCVAFGQLPNPESIEDFQAAQEYELVCPLFDQYATTVLAGDRYSIKYEVFSNNSAIAAAVLGDIETAGDVFLDYEAVVQWGFLVTWTDARFASDACTAPCNSVTSRNTFQLAVAVVNAQEHPNRSPYTFATFNFAKIEKVSTNTKAGIIFGDNKGFTPLPFSDNTNYIRSYLASKSTIIGKAGAYVYDVTELPQRIGCLDFSDVTFRGFPEPLTTSVKSADMFGGSIIRVQGHCGSEPAASVNVSCVFTERDAVSGQADTKAKAWYYSRYTIICISPRSDLGRSSIIVSLIGLAEGVTFSSDFYFGAQTAANADVQIESGNNYLEENIAGNINLSWQPDVFGISFRAMLDVLLVAFKTFNGTVVTETFTIGAVGREEGSYEVDTSKVCAANDSKCEGFLIGTFVLQMQNYETSPMDKYYASKVAISSMPIPIGWYVRNYHRQKFGTAWYQQYCQPTYYPPARQYCPCSRDLARFDTRSFSPAPDCLVEGDRLSRCQLQGQTQTYCYSGTTLGTQGIRCCYNQNNDLIYSNDNPVSGSYILPYAPIINYREFGITGARTYLTYYLSHVKNFYSCCTAQGLSKPRSAQCSRFASSHQVPEICADHKPSVFSAVAGDPHFQMPDGQTYTFNGIGEYWYATSSDADELKIQIRLGRATSKYGSAALNYGVQATVVKAIALKQGQNTIQVQVQPLSYLNEQFANTKRLMIYVNNVEQYWNEDQEVRFFDNFRIVSRGPGQNLFHITLLDDGALVACDYTETADADGPQSPGSMNCRISYSSDKVQSVAGLIGKKVGNEFKLVEQKDWNAANPTGADLTSLSSVNTIAETWKIEASDSLFTYVATTFAQVNNKTGHNPILNWTPPFISGDATQAKELATCGSSDTYSRQCSYDYRVTGSDVLAGKTKQDLEVTDEYRLTVSAEQKFCSALTLPFTVRSQTNGNRLGSVINVTGCVENYEPVGSVTFPFSLTCTDQSGKYDWLPASGKLVGCTRSSLYSTANAKTLDNPYTNASAATLGMTDFSAVYLGRKLTGVLAYVQLGCIVLSSTPEEGYEPMICPLIADHSTAPPSGFTDSYKFLYQTVTASDPAGLLSEIAADIKEAGQSFDASYGDAAITTAYVFTWLDATYRGACTNAATCATAPRNRYQVAIAVSSSGKAFAIINYGRVAWSGRERPGNDPSAYSFAGFYFGDRKGSLLLPFSNATTSEIAKLATSGTLLSLTGRFVYDISTFPQPTRLGCYASDVALPTQQPLSISNPMMDIFGGNVIRFQGSCLSTIVNTWCAFEQRTPTGPKWTFTPVYDKDVYTGACVTPRAPNIDVGWTRIGLTTDNGLSVNFASDIYFSTLLNGGLIGQLDFLNPDNKFWLSAQPNTSIELRWFGKEAFGSPENLRVELHVVGYHRNGSTYDFPTIASARMSDSAIRIPTPLPQCSQSTCKDILIGQLALNVVSDDVQEVLTSTNIQRLTIASPLLPVGWYTNDLHKSLLGNAWYQSYCDASVGRLAVETLPQCPCTRSSAIYEERVFFEAPDCYRPIGIGILKETCYLTPSATKCYTTLPTSKGHSIRCCYDQNDNLIQPQSAPLDGSYMLPDAVSSNYQVFDLAGTNALLTYYHSHVANMFACCSAHIYGTNTVPTICSELSYNRAASKTCAGFRYSYWSATVGDPHFVTFDGAKYTFNGIGEFWHVYSKEATFDTKIQVRITKAQDSSLNAVRAGVLSALAFEFRGSKVEIHVQPLSFRQSGSKYLTVLVDGVERFWTNLVEEQFYKNFRIVTFENQFSVTVTAMDNGPLVYCKYYDASSLNTFGGMTCRVSVPNYYRRSIYGLAGYADEDVENDLVSREKVGPWDVEFVDPTNMTAVHYNFGTSWNVRKEESIFSYLDDSWELFNRELQSYVPVLNLPPNLNIISNSSINDACGTGVNRVRCQYDYELTRIESLARQTKVELDNFDRLIDSINRISSSSCQYLDLAYANVTLSGYSVGSTAVVNGCFAGYTATTSFPVTYVCQQDGDQQPSWTPSPSTLCRSPNVILGQQTSAVKVDPYNPAMPNYTLPEKIIRTNSITFGGRQITGFSIIAKSGCVALKENVTDASVEGVPEGISDVPLLCPLFASHATTRQSNSDSYTIYFKQIEGRSPLLTELLLDIQAASVDLDPSIVQAEITNAYIFTWENARSSSSVCNSEATCGTASRNTYEVVLVVTNQLQTYAVFNYKSINWSGWESGTGADVLSFAAINYGDNRGTVYLPYSKLTGIENLATLSTIVGVNGRFIYQVTDRIQRIGCLNLPSTYPAGYTQPVTLNTFIGDVYGSRRLVVQSACLPQAVDSWVCGYRKSAASTWLTTTKVYRLSDYSAACSSPRLPAVDYGEWEIGVLSNPQIDSPRFIGKIYLAESIEDSTPVKLNDTLKWFSATPSDALRVEWLPSWFENKPVVLDVYIVAYAQAKPTGFLRREFSIGKTLNQETAFEFTPKDNLCDQTCQGYLVGQVVLRVSNTSIMYDPTIRYTEIASSLVPTGWLVNDYYVKETSNNQWYFNYCDTTTVDVSVKCPCTSTLAEADSRTFIAAPSCDDVFGAECVLSPAATKCFTTLPLAAAGQGLLCCYDNDNTLIYGQDEPFGGSYSLQYVPSASDSVFGVTDATSYLSYYYGHTKNLFACCTANTSNVANSRCYEYTEARSVPKKCTDYEVSGVSGVVGDPHVLTPDNTIYSFNGVGEYWWVFVQPNADYRRPVRVQVRFQNKFKASVTNAPQVSISASLLTAIAISLDDSYIHVEVQGVSYQFGAGRKLAIYVNDVEKIFYDHPTDQYFSGARIESSPIQDSVKINLPYNGPSIECSYVSLIDSMQVGSMSCVILLTPAYKTKSYGLIGKYDGSNNNDLINRGDISLANPTPASSDNFEAVHAFGLTWRVSLAESGFEYLGTSFDEVNQDIDSFIPALTLKPGTTLNTSDIAATCPPASQYAERCEYDYRLTKSKTLATDTGSRLRSIRSKQVSLVVDNAFCPFLDIPYARKQLSQGIKVGSTAVIVGCIDKYVRNPAAPTQYRCNNNAGSAEWQPSPVANTCQLPADATTTVVQPSSGSTASTASTASTSTVANDSTVEIILGVLLGVAVVVIVALIVFYFVSVAPKISKLAATAPTSVELASSSAPAATKDSAAV